MCASWPAGSARADGIGGYLDFNYSNSDTETRDAAGVTTKTKVGSFFQRYNLNLNRTFFPTLTMNAGGSFEKNSSTVEAEGSATDASSARLRPFVDLLLSTPLFTGGAGYNRDEERSKSNGISSSARVRENYTGRFGWRPDGFPTVDLTATRTNDFDKDRSQRDTVNDRLNISTRYNPVKGMDLSYQGSFDDFTDKLTNNEVRQTSHDGRVTYSGSYLKNRANFNTSYGLTRKQTEVIASGRGEVSFLLSPSSDSRW